MNQYEIVNAGHIVDGYFLPHPLESPEDTFTRAKAEAERHLLRGLENIRALSLRQFSSQLNADPKTP